MSSPCLCARLRALACVVCFLCICVLCLSQVISQGYPLSPSLAILSLQPTISSKHLHPHSPPEAPGPRTLPLFCLTVERGGPLHQSTALFIFMYRREAKKAPSRRGLYWLGIKWTLSSDSQVIYEAVIKAGALSYVRTRSRMKAAHTEHWYLTLVSPCLGGEAQQMCQTGLKQLGIYGQ